MTLIVPDDGSPEPRTHALVIGVGRYRHLPGGGEEVPQALEHVGLLKQLTSPPHSAIAFAGWLREAGAALRAPLGSLDLLVSPAPAQPDVIPADMAAAPATMANIQRAYNEWRARCDRNEDNIAIFYYCGHGAEKAEQYLLAEDFGQNPLNPWLGAFAFDSTRLAFNASRAKTQCFFVDACRRLTSGMLVNEPNAMALEVQNLLAPECAFNLTMKASAKNEVALGPKRGVSYFTQALLRAFNGAAATQGPRGWIVETGPLAAHITAIMRLIKASEGFPQRCSSQVTDSTDLLAVQAPRVPVWLGCRPEQANPVAKLSCLRRDVVPHPPDEHEGGPWTFEVAPGMYIASASFAGDEFRPAQADVIAVPPLQRRELECGQ